MFKTAAFSLFVILLFETATAQKDDKNISIKESVEEYKFIKGNKENPVQVRQELQTTYICNEFRTSIQVAEFYDNQTEINDVDVWIDGDRQKRFTPTYEPYNSDGIFYSDAKVCYFTLPLEKKGTTSKVRFGKKILDPRYFTNVFFTEPYFVARKEVNIVVPKWMKIEIKEFNFTGYSITKNVNNKSDEDVYTYVIENAPALNHEAASPGITYIAPHLLIMTKYAEPEGERITYFNTLADQYGWYRQLVKQIGNDPASIRERATQITKGMIDDLQKVKAIYQWVQDNIRYIAFEDGIAGFKPDNAQEVLRKKYGDCKGMGNLMAEMLKSIGLDGRICWLGTNHIAYDYSTPSLGVDNHVICAWLYKGKTYFLDATEKYIGFGETAERIQGRQVLIEDGDKYILQNIPVATQQQNTSTEKRILTLNGNNLEGKVIQTWKGESKEWLLTQLHEIKKEKQEDALKQFLTEGRNNFQISDLKIINLNDYNADLKIEYNLLFKDAVTSFGKENYIDIDDRRDFTLLKFDTSKRKLPYLFPFKENRVLEVEIQLPKDAKAGQLPSAFKIDQPDYSMNGSYIAEPSKIVYRREITLKKTWMPKQDFIKWNNDIDKLNEFYNNQLVITK
ncbi:MAG TPA: transglutaminase domain-containing protein [Chitinophagaceae bacterium]|nr:transglutaminase domain-containing protein [Chitinophagaceae bacterium]